MSSTRADVIAELKRPKTDPWRIMNRIEGIVPDHKERAELLLDILRVGDADVGVLGHNLFYTFSNAKLPINGDDALDLIDAIAHAWPNGRMDMTGGSYHSMWSDHDLAGHPHGMDYLLNPMMEDEAKVAQLLAGWAELPTPYNHGVGFILYAHGKLTADALPQAMLDQLLDALCRRSDGGAPWVTRFPWPKEVWGPRLYDKLLRATPPIHSSYAFQFISAWATPDQLLALLDVADTYSMLWYVTTLSKTLADQGPAIKPLLEAKMRGAMASGIQTPSWQQRQAPEVYWGFAWLMLCKAAGEEPSADFDAFWRHIAQKVDYAWSGSQAEELWGLLRLIPTERLEDIFLAGPGFHWSLAGAVQSEAMARKALAQLSVPIPQGSNFYYNVSSLSQALFVAMGQHALKPLIEALEKGTGQRQFMMERLVALQHPDSIPVLCKALGDKAKGTRELAITTLAKLPAEQVVAALEKPLKAKKRDERFAAAQVLAELPTSEGRYKLAQEALQAESVEDIKQLLSSVHAPDEAVSSASGVGREEVIAELKESQGAAWAKHEGLGEELVTIYADVLEQAFNRSVLTTYQTLYNHWLEVLERFKASELALRRALRVAPAMRDYYGADYLNALDARFTGVLAPEIARLLVADRWERPTVMGKCRGSYGEDRALSWLMEKHPAEGLGVVFGLLGDARVTRFELAQTHLMARKDDEDVSARLEAALSDAQPLVRQRAAALLAKMGKEEARPAIEAALAKETDKAAAEALSRARLELGGAAMEVEACPPTAEGDAMLDAKLAARWADLPAPYKIEPAKLPKVRWATGAELSPKAQGWLLQSLTREGEGRQDTLLWAVRPRLDGDSAEEFCGALIRQSGYDDHGWLLYMQAVLASSERIRALGARLEDFSRSSRHGWGSHGVDVMVRHGGPEAIRALDHWARKARSNALKKRAPWGLQRMARKRGVTVEELVDGALPDLGFGLDGRQVLDFGPRSFVVRLVKDDEVVLEDQAGNALKALPAANKADDAAKAAAAKAHLSLVKKELKRMLAAQAERLELAMCEGRRWSQAAWRARFLGHPLVKHLAQGLLFEHLDEAGKARPFLINPKGEVAWLDGFACVLPEGGEVRIAHPADLSDEVRERADQYMTRLRDPRAYPPFEQLLRSVHRLDPGAEDLGGFLKKLPLTTEAKFLSALAKQRYEYGAREDAGLISYSSRTLGPWVVSLGHYGISPEVRDHTRQDVDVRSANLYKDGVHIAWKDAPTALLSEVLRDLIELTK